MNDQTRSRYSVSTVCLRQYDLVRALDVARSLGFDSVDLVGLRGLCEHVPVNGTTSEMSAAARTFAASGLRAASVNADPGSFDGFDDPVDVMRRVERLIDFAVEAGAPILVLPAGEKSEQRTTDPQIARMADALNEAGARAARNGVRLAVEAPYFGRPIDRLARAAELMDALDPSIQLAFDVSHIEAADESVAHAWQLLAARVAIVHLRDAVSGDIRRVIGQGRVDFPAVFDAMRSTDYAGDTVLELETRNSPYASKKQEVLAAVEYLDAARTAASRTRS
ncbi:sugar phosphate isomerase/epimerase family protein [Micromonospora sp. DT81.3]|uniref:sugar phosphate isomerase/epimerase family protein n=1 Tax=Micromonospora sp. DT81.3 TaxID=3416523 RepID=UPI003CF4F6E4